MNDQRKLNGVPHHAITADGCAKHAISHSRTRESDSAYYARRAAEELAFAAGRDNELAASLHRDLAARYEQLAAANRDPSERF